jgi:hypothetical protein
MVSLEATGNIFRRAYTGKPMRLWSCTNKSITFKANGGARGYRRNSHLSLRKS